MESKFAKYEKLAREAQDRARRTDDLESKRAWLKIANDWMSLGIKFQKLNRKNTDGKAPTAL